METLMVRWSLFLSMPEGVGGANLMTDSAMHEAVAAIAACGVSPVVRIAANETWMVKRALDSGGLLDLIRRIRTG